MEGNQEPTLNDVMGVLRSMNDRFDTVDGRLDDITRRLGSVESKVDDLQETVDGIAKAVDKDAVTLVDYGRRISKLERA